MKHIKFGNTKENAIAAVVITAILAVACITIFVLSGIICKHEIKGASQQFVESLSIGNASEAIKLSGGEVKFQLSNLGDVEKAEILGTDIEFLEWNKNWARVNIKVDCLLCDGSYDVDWYAADLYKDNGWKVMRFKSSYPMKMNGLTAGQEEEEFKRIFLDYYGLLLAGQNDLATKKYLAGPARNEQEKNKRKLEFKYNIKDVKTNILLYSRDYAVVDVKYTLGKRAVNNAVHFYNTEEGWKIIDIVSK